MKYLKLFETWNDNIIDNSLFVSGRAKYEPNVANGRITYRTGNSEPFYHAEITKKGDKFICKVYKRKKDGTDKRIKNKIKKTLKTAHNYVREYLNQRLKNKMKKKQIEEVDLVQPEVLPEIQPMATPMEPMIEPKSKTVIHRFY